MRKPTIALITTLDGTMYMVDRQESGSMKVICAFSTGAPIYHSYKAPIRKDMGKENVSAALISGFVECGEDWALYMHDKHFGKKRISESIAEYVARMPTFSDDGAVTLGSKRSTLFEVDAETGRILQIHAMSDFDSASDAVMLSSPDLLLKIFRTDYCLQSVDPSSGIVWWTVTVAEFEAVLTCQRNSFDAEDGYASFAMLCPYQEIQQVFRLQKNIVLEPSITQRLTGDGNDMLSMLTSTLMLQCKPKIDGFFSGHEFFSPDPMPNYLPSLQRKISVYSNNDNADVLPQPLMVFTTPEDIYRTRTNEWSTPLPLTLFLGFLFGLLLICRHLVVKKQVISKDKNISRANKKKTRKSRKNNDTVGKKEKHLSSENDDVLTQKNNDMASVNQVDEGVDGRRIDKLFVSNKEIAKGSNGTILLEGIYEGRAVAVKRLVKAHYDVANKEIQNLILSDCHPNIVRWHGVEYDQDFVYLALERCACSLDSLVLFYSDISENSVFMEDQAFKCAQMETWKDNMQDLWKANDYPSPLLLKLLRDVVSGIVHLHELGIIHRDLKPQNVLIIKEKSLCAKLSDMGIGKRLLGDTSSLGHNATGGGSSGWQALEQLVPGRQTRAVDLFGLGCVLFYCLTRGRHPFGERLERDINIVKDKKDLFLVDFIPEAEDLISCLLNPDPDLRPKAAEVLHHPFFWSSELRLSFLRDTSDRVELEDREIVSDLLNTLESVATVAIGGKWDVRMESAFLANIGNYRRYNFCSVRDLLRVMRNKLNHYRELPHEIQELVGPVPEGFNGYFASRYPRLLIEVYKVICKYCKEEECFQRYFKSVD